MPVEGKKPNNGHSGNWRDNPQAGNRLSTANKRRRDAMNQDAMNRVSTGADFKTKSEQRNLFSQIPPTKNPSSRKRPCGNKWPPQNPAGVIRDLPTSACDHAGCEHRNPAPDFAEPASQAGIRSRQVPPGRSRIMLREVSCGLVSAVPQHFRDDGVGVLFLMRLKACLTLQGLEALGGFRVSSHFS